SLPVLPEIRLSNGPSRCQGRVEILYNGSWGTVCDDDWDIVDANVVCRQLGCGHAITLPAAMTFGQGSGPIFLDNVDCKGWEAALSECWSHGWGIHNCYHYEDVAVVCNGSEVGFPGGKESKGAPGGLQALGGADALVEPQESYPSLCSSNPELAKTPLHPPSTLLLNPGHLPAPHAASSCMSPLSLCVTTGLDTSTITSFTTSVALDSEETLTATATAVTDGRDQPSQATDVVTTMLLTVEQESGGVRLANGNGSCRGRVEVRHRGTWGTVCDDDWDFPDAQVVCRQLGCGAALAATVLGSFGYGSGPVLLDNVGCGGGEARLADCFHLGWGQHNCGHHEDAGVICRGESRRGPGGTPAGGQVAGGGSAAKLGSPVPSTGSLRLVNGSHRCEGRVEMFYLSQWGTVCDDAWDLRDAKVVCRQVGCGHAMAAWGEARYGQGTGYIFLDNLKCKGHEPSLLRCSHIRWDVHNCDHSEDAGAVCDIL
ncbi:DMBT1 protein, partial [Mionectes macconnelli]|nr:DMBT1 protein [Mionectes macconnelli]